MVATLFEVFARTAKVTLSPSTVTLIDSTPYFLSIRITWSSLSAMTHSASRHSLGSSAAASCRAGADGLGRDTHVGRPGASGRDSMAGGVSCAWPAGGAVPSAAGGGAARDAPAAVTPPARASAAAVTNRLSFLVDILWAPDE